MRGWTIKRSGGGEHIVCKKEQMEKAVFGRDMKGVGKVGTLPATIF